MIRYALFDTAIGRCGITWSPRGVLGLQLPEKTHEGTRLRLLRHAPTADESEPPSTHAHAIADIQALLNGEKRSLRAVTLDMSRVPHFHALVYDAARAIPPGQTRTYGDIARTIGQRSAARAVGQALGRNPFAIIVPCHRVVGVDGRMIGFSASGGIALKLRMLEIEGWAPAPTLFDALLT
ncbi:MAG: methylated-DNA--[protein]-cysteine S-methyltransferase [Pseudomonadota bacterium]